MSIGERLEEARKRQGISIREAAEATKIRGDYLMAMEDNSMDIPLPDIYVRGFLRNYARFLKLDPAKILTDYDAHQLGKVARSGNQRSFGRIELGREGRDDSYEETPYTGRPRGQQTQEELKPEAAAQQVEDTGGDGTLYVKIGVVVGGLALLVALILMLFNLLQPGIPSNDGPELNPDLRPMVDGDNGAQIETGAGTRSGELLIRATDNVTLIVEDAETGEPFFRGSLNAGDSTPVIALNGRVLLKFDRSEALVIEKDGQTFRLGGEGSGRRFIDP